MSNTIGNVENGKIMEERRGINHGHPTRIVHRQLAHYLKLHILVLKTSNYMVRIREKLTINSKKNLILLLDKSTLGVSIKSLKSKVCN